MSGAEWDPSSIDKSPLDPRTAPEGRGHSYLCPVCMEAYETVRECEACCRAERELMVVRFLAARRPGGKGHG